MNVNVRCPICSETAEIEVAKKELGKASRGLLSVSIPENLVCEHSFITYIDRNFKVRDYFVPDFEINLRGLGSVMSAEGEGEPPSSTPSSKKTEAEKGTMGAPKLPANCKPGDLIEQEYKNNTLLSYIFSYKNKEDKKELFSFSILLNKDQKIKLYKLVVQEFIDSLKQHGLLNEKILKNYQQKIFTSFNEESDLEVENISIPLSGIFKAKKKELKRLRLEEMKGSFF